MKRLLLILAIYVLASVGVQAQVVGEEPYEILWEMEFDSTNYFNSNSFCISADSTSYYYQGGVNNFKEFIYKRNIETNELEFEFKMPYSIDSSGLWDMQISDKYLSYIKAYKDGIILRDPNTFEFIKKLKIDINQLINNFDSKYKDLYFEQFQLTNNSKYAIVMYSFRDYEHKYYYILVAYDINNDTYKMFYSNLDWQSIDQKIEKLQLSNDGNKLYAIRYYGYSPGDLDFGFYEWNISNDFEVKDLYLNLNSHDISDTYNYKISLDDSKILLYSDGSIIRYLYYDIDNRQILKKENLRSIRYNFCFTEYEHNIITTLRMDGIYNNVVYNIFSDNFNTIYSSEKYEHLLYQVPLYYNPFKSMLISGVNNLFKKNNEKIIALKFNYDTIMGAKEEEGKIELLYPNPATETINIPINENTERIEVYDVSGNVVYSTPSLQGNATTQEGNYLIDISQLPVGTYFVKVYQTESIIDYKFIKG